YRLNSPERANVDSAKHLRAAAFPAERTGGRTCACGRYVTLASGRSAPNDRLARLMAKAGYTSHKAFARAVRRVSEEQADRTPIGCDHTSVSRWLSGMNPRSDTAQCIVTALSRALGRRVSLAEAGLAASAATPPDLGLDSHASAEDALGDLARLWHADLGEAAAVTSRPEQPGA